MINVTFQTLIRTLFGISPELTRELNPPADAAHIERLIQDLPFTFPDDLRTLYKLHNGENEMGELFFGLPWLSLEAALSEWHIWAELASGEDKSIKQTLSSVPAGCVKKKMFNTYYFPISIDWGGNCLMIDLDPDEKGMKGQVINYGRDETTRYVIAPSLDDFLAFCIHQLQIGNYLVKEEDGKKRLLLQKPDNAHFLDTLPHLNLPFQAER